MPQYIYKLVDPSNNKPFYVGITDNPEFRLSQHLQRNDNNQLKNSRISEILAREVKPQMYIINIVQERREAEILETHWIHTYLNQREFWISQGRSDELE